MAEIALEWHVGLRAKRWVRWGGRGRGEVGREREREREGEREEGKRKKERERGRNEMQNVSIYTTLLLSLACLAFLSFPALGLGPTSPYPARSSRIASTWSRLVSSLSILSVFKPLALTAYSIGLSPQTRVGYPYQFLSFPYLISTSNSPSHQDVGLGSLAHLLALFTNFDRLTSSTVT